MALSDFAVAHPVPFKDAVAVTSLNQRFQTDMMVAYSFKRSAAVAMRIMAFDDGLGKMNYYAPQVNFLLRRWNGDGYQANIYSAGGVGLMNFDGHEHSAILTSVEADAESRWLYISGQVEKMWTGEGYDFWHFRSRAGFAPYAAGFDQLATWFMVQYEYNPLLRGWSKITPLARLYYRNYLVEAGVSLNGDGMANFMAHF